MTLPNRSWDRYEATLRALGEHSREPVSRHELDLLRSLGLVASGGTLTSAGAAYFEAAFIHRDLDVSTRILGLAVADYPPASLVLQALAGVKQPTRDVARTVLRRHGYGENLTDRALGALLVLMRRAGLITYGPLSGAIHVEAPPSTAIATPATLLVSPDTPYTNKMWLRRVLAECTGSIRWLDKHFLPAAFGDLLAVADAQRITRVRVLSLALDGHESRLARRDTADATAELLNRGITLEWHVIDAPEVRDTHDRWIIGDATAWNVPNVNAILSGQHSELSRSDNRDQLAALFDRYWLVSKPR